MKTGSSSEVATDRFMNGLAGSSIALIFIVMLLLAFFFFKDSNNGEEISDITVHDIKLVKHDGSNFTEAEFAGKWNYVFFGYMNCPDVCPATLMQLNQFYKQVNVADEKVPLPQVVFVSVDGKRDKPEDMQDYVHYFNPAFVGVTGSEEEINKLVKQVNAFYRLENAGKAGNYEVTHSADVFIINPQGKLVKRLSPPMDIYQVVADYKMMADFPKSLALGDSFPSNDYGIR